MPVVRDVPLFPEGDVQPGQSWVAQGNETHDLRNSFGIPDPFSYPITASYTYTGNETRNGVACAVFTINYDISHKFTPPQGTTGLYPRQRCWPLPPALLVGPGKTKAGVLHGGLRLHFPSQHGRRRWSTPAMPMASWWRPSPWTAAKWRGRSRARSRSRESPTSRSNPPRKGLR